MEPASLKQRSAAFSVKGHVLNMFNIAGSVMSVTTTQLCICSEKTAVDNTETNEQDYDSQEMYLLKQTVAWIWLTGHHLSNPYPW